MQRKNVTSKRRFRPDTPVKEARVQSGIKLDPDNPKLTPERLQRMRPFRELQAGRRRGRSKSTMCKEPVTLSLNPTPPGRSVFRDLFPTEEAAELEMRSSLLRGLKRWLEDGEMTPTAAAKVLRVTQARVSDVKRGKINQFSLDLLVRLASRAGLWAKMRLTGKTGGREFARAEAVG